MPSTYHYRACDLCEAICGLEFRYDDGRLAAIRGDDEDPFSRGHVCPKGNAIIDLESDPDRLRRPLKRIGTQWHELGWDEAYAEAGERLAAVQREHGANAVAAYLGNPNVHHFGHLAYLPAFLRGLKTRNVYSASSVDQWPHQYVARLMYGHQFLIPIPDIDRTDFLLMLGANPVASNGSLMTAPGAPKRLKAIAARGRLVVIDPRRTETAELANEHHFIRPGTDALFLIALLRDLVALGPSRTQRYDGRISGLEQALAALAAVPLDDFEARTGIARETASRLARDLWQAPSAAVYGRMGLSTQPYGTLCQWLIQLIHLHTGNLDREGGSIPNDVVMPITGPGTARGHVGRWRSRVRGLPEFAGEFPVSILREEIETPGEGQVRALVTVAGNPTLSTPNGDALAKAISSLDFMLSIDIYLNETTRHAHLILPPTSSLSQYHYDLIFNAFAVRRVARVSAPIVDQPQDERADWQILNALGASHARAQSREWRDLPPPRDLIAMGLARGGSGIDVDTLEGAPHGMDLGPLRPCLLDRLETESSRIECAPDILLEELNRLARSERERDPQALLLIGRRELRSNNSWMHNAPRLAKGKPRHHLLVHPEDLKSRGLRDGQRVRVRSAVGEIQVEVEASDDMMRGVISLPHGYGHDQHGTRLGRANQVPGPSYNDLTDPAALDVPTGNAALNALPVRIEALAGIQ